MSKDNNYVDSIMKTIKSSKILAVLIVASIALIGLGSLTDAIDKIINFSHSYMSETVVAQKSVERIPLPPKTTIANQSSNISTVVMVGCIVVLFVSVAVFFVKWKRNIKSNKLSNNKSIRPKGPVVNIEKSQGEVVAPKFPDVTWLTVKDIMRICGWSIDILKQHIGNGLHGHVKSSGADKTRPLDKDRDLIALEEWPEQADSLIEQWLFKTDDVEKYMKSTQQIT